MTSAAVFALACIVLVAVVSTVIGSFGVRFARNTSDFLVASRTVGATTNASAISGEFLSAASFLGVVGLILKRGPDALWYPIGFTAGYLAVLLFVSAPLRRSGAYTVSDFAEFRLRSPAVQRVCTLFVIVIGWMYLVPQLQGAGLTVATVAPEFPAWSGIVAAGVAVVATVVFGAMRSITFVQAFQYWLKLTALIIPLMVLLSLVGIGNRPYNRPAPPEFPADSTLTVDTPVVLRVAVPVNLQATGVVDGAPVDGSVHWQPGEHVVDAGSSLRFAAHTPVPVPVGTPTRDSSWLTPSNQRGGDGPDKLIGIYSLIVATFLGTMGLPHVLGRFFTNPDGRATRRTTVAVLAMLGGFYLLPTLLGVLSRLYVPQLLVSGDTDAAVLLLPRAALGAGQVGIVLGGLVAAGAWAAFLSTSCGLVVGIAGVLSASPTVLRRTGMRDFRVAALVAGGIPVALSLVSARQDSLVAVSLAFSVAASTFCPLLMLGIWWRGLTDRGALAGLLVGGLSSTAAVVSSMFGAGGATMLGVLLERPALVTVPLAFLTMFLVSAATSGRVLPDTPRLMLRLHAPERLGLSAQSRDGADEEPADIIPGLG
ncbi:MAG TPA: cation acetate symporter [Pseudonocardia sp.]|jgi:Na+(H+)/acetate symporter ActP|nr:cation acetate symporter [Pseudonocardia sp.]